MTQDRKHHGNNRQDATEEVKDAPQGAEKSEGIDEDVDSILEEIDDVLETNAEEFVKGFIQKGGQ